MKLEKAGIDDIKAVLSIADECVGKNLYSEEDFLSAVNGDGRFLLVLRNPLLTIVGYIYYLITETGKIESGLGLEKNTLSPSGPCGRIQSVALRNDSRGMGYSVLMIRAAVETFLENGISAVYAVCWKPGDVPPLSSPLKKCGFSYLMTVDKPWYSSDKLFCPYCGGRCSCDADIYYRKLDVKE